MPSRTSDRGFPHFMIWDTGDGDLDSSVLLDNFKWAEGEVQVITDRPR